MEERWCVAWWMSRHPPQTPARLSLPIHESAYLFSKYYTPCVRHPVGLVWTLYCMSLAGLRIDAWGSDGRMDGRTEGSMDVRWMSDGCQMDVRWMSDGCQMDVRWMSDQVDAPQPSTLVS
jgi:hypothetical protein